MIYLGMQKYCDRVRPIEVLFRTLRQPGDPLHAYFFRGPKTETISDETIEGLAWQITSDDVGWPPRGWHFSPGLPADDSHGGSTEEIGDPHEITRSRWAWCNIAGGVVAGRIPVGSLRIGNLLVAPQKMLHGALAIEAANQKLARTVCLDHWTEDKSSAQAMVNLWRCLGGAE